MKKSILILFLVHSIVAFSQKSAVKKHSLKSNNSTAIISLPCQSIEAFISSSLPSTHSDGIIRICQGESVQFEGEGVFSLDGTGAVYHWDFGNGNFGTGEDVEVTYPETGLFTVNLVITDTNPEGCSSTNINSQLVYVSSTPDFSNTVAAETSICLGESTTLEGIAVPQMVVANCANNGEMAVLDDVGEYISVLDLNCFDSEILSDVSQLESICLVLEHSYLGDLEITVTSPDGREVVLHDRDGGSLFVGSPTDVGVSGPGIGWEYCFTMSATSLLGEGPTELSGTPDPKPSVQAGSYLPLGDFNDFVGTTIDGQWELKIIDHESSDDGTIFGWSLNFEEALISTDISFTPTIDTEAWVADASITDTTGNTITVQPTTAGTHCYTYSITDNFDCVYTKEVCIEVFPEVLPITPTELQECDDDSPDESTSFNLSIKENEITGGNTNWLVSYFETPDDAQNNINSISSINAYENTSNPQLIYLRVSDNTTGCFAFSTMSLRVLKNPEPLADAENLEFCDLINTGDNQEEFDLTQNEAYILNNEPDLIASYYESLGDAQSGVNGISNPTTYINLSQIQTIFVAVENTTTGCFAIVDFDIIVHPLPQMTNISDFIVCEVNADGVNTFDLETKTTDILNGQDPSVFGVTYHLTQADADAGVNPLIGPYLNMVNPRPIYVNITNSITQCAISSMRFNLEEISNPTANSNGVPIEYSLCDTLGDNDGVAEFDLNSQNELVLDGQDPADHVVSYYLSQSDADLDINALDDSFENTENPQVIYARVESSLTTNTSCYATSDLKLEVHLLPEFNLENSYTLCVNTNGTELVRPPLLETGLSEIDYSFEWRFNDVIISGANNSNYLVDQSGAYSVTAMNRITNCQKVARTIVIESSPPEVSASVTSPVFSGANVIEVEVIGTGDYEYSLDDDLWQDSNVFEDVSTGEHTVKVRDVNGCGISVARVMVMDYPKYFTPNGDGYHDTWNIVGINAYPDAKIFIFDRYGKLMKQLSPLGNGWDGTYNGKLMIPSDYWFTVEFTEAGDTSIKRFSAHFSLKKK